ncbi:MAG: DUF5060 domain-containing protein [Verrucomicrobiota bacterium]
MVINVCTFAAEPIASVEVYAVAELTFTGPRQKATDSPARDIDFSVTFLHEDGKSRHVIHGFFDGDGKGGVSGDSFKVRFCPTRPGRWTLSEVKSSAPELKGEREGQFIIARTSKRPGFWLADAASAGGRWFKRSDGSHPYIVGNTQYSFLSGRKDQNQPSGVDIAADMAANARYFKKVRFSLHGDRYVHPEAKPFLDDAGKPTDSGDFSHRPNPAWFHQRADTAVAAAFEHDLIADLILAGPDTEESRSTLRAGRNNGNPAPWLKYIAARYGSYPNVWICLCNEYNIRTPTYSEREVAKFGEIIRSFLPYSSPLSVHASPPIVWADVFDTLPQWNTHQIVQKKLRTIGPSADVMGVAWGVKAASPRHKPTINDELSYEGEGDKHTREDTVESHLGAFLGGGYASTGYKAKNKIGHYFWGGFNPKEHTAAESLKFLRQVIDNSITFWNMAPSVSIFSGLDEEFRGMAWDGREYVLGTNKPRQGLRAKLPPGQWKVTRHDIIKRESEIIAEDANGDFRFDAPESRAVLFHFKKY